MPLLNQGLRYESTNKQQVCVKNRVCFGDRAKGFAEERNYISYFNQEPKKMKNVPATIKSVGFITKKT